MNITITGSKGFIGSALKKRLEADGHTIYTYLRPDVEVVYLFGAPSSNIQYDQNIDKCFFDTINNFLDAIRFCRDHKIKLVYPSSATVYNKNTSYARCKAALEEIHQAYGGDVLGLRIFAGYGPGEGPKGEYASVVYQFCKLMKAGQRPTIYGNGNQTRDFVYIDDIVSAIIEKTATHQFPITDIGTGINTSFNQLVGVINDQLKTNIAPIFINRPEHYIDTTPCYKPLALSTDIETGVRNVLRSL